MKVALASKTISILTDVSPTVIRSLKTGELFILRKGLKNPASIDELEAVTIYLVVEFNGQYWGCDIDGVAPHILISKDNPLHIFRLKKRLIDYSDDTKKVRSIFYSPKGKSIFVDKRKQKC